MKESPTQVLYEDDRITCTNSAVIIRGYYFPLATAKSVPYRDIRGVEQIELGSGRWRIWGGTDPRYWFHLDLKRPHKHWALVLELGKRIRPVITPDDPARVKVVIEQHLGG
jgi:hypothetical protein